MKRTLAPVDLNVDVLVGLIMEVERGEGFQLRYRRPKREDSPKMPRSVAHANIVDFGGHGAAFEWLLKRRR